MGKLGDGVRAKDRVRDERRARARKQKAAMLEAEQRELEETRELQARLKAEYLARRAKRAT